jgi:transcriptional regulator with XRE-family HTH domain
MSPTYITTGKVIREAREILGYSLKDIAHVVQISPQYLHQMELGKVPVPSDRAQAIANALNISISKIAGAMAEDTRNKYLRKANNGEAA